MSGQLHDVDVAASMGGVKSMRAEAEKCDPL